MRGSFIKPATAALFALASFTGALAQSPNPACQQLEAQLTSLDRGNSDPARADQIRRAEDAVNRQQYEVDRLVSQGRQMGCENSGFFSIFSNPPPQCGGLNRQIGQQRTALERLQVQLEQLQGGTAQRAAQRQSLLMALGNNNCGPQYRAAVQAGQQRGFFDTLFGTGTNNSGGPPAAGGGGGGIISSAPGPMGGTYRTVCVRTCDGYYFPISFTTTQDHFRDDEQACQRMCPAAEVQLYTYHNPGEEMSQAVSLGGQPYTSLPTAFQYRKALSSACSCRHPGESWAQALKVNGTDTTVAPGDVVVTEQNAKRLSLPRVGADGKPIKPELRGNVSATGTTPATTPPQSSATADAPIDPDAAKRSVRTVGPTFIPAR